MTTEWYESYKNMIKLRKKIRKNKLQAFYNFRVKVNCDILPKKNN